ncbi:MAG: N-acetylglucosaminidase [Legionella sp.]
MVQTGYSPGLWAVKPAKTLTDKGEVFLQAAKDNNLHPVYLVVHALVESAHGKSDLAKQNNFFGIGANDGKAYAAGTKFSKEHGWNSPDEGIMGGAQVISKKWVNHPSQSQCSLYGMRWNYMNAGVNQYATDVNWAHGLSKMIANIVNSKSSNYQPTLIIPQYRS